MTLVPLPNPANPAPTSPTRARKLHRGHFAFMRALVQGLPTRESWDRYLRVEGEHTDLRAVRSTIAWIRGEFAAAARRERRHGTARLVLVDAGRIVDDAQAAPSLEDFACARGLEEFSEAEQLEAYAAEYGSPNPRANRRARLISRQLDALHWLEALVAQPPRAGDAVAAWLHPRLATKLEAAGLFTLAELAARVNGVGRGWAASVPGIGAVKAERLVDWLRAHAASLGLPIGAHVAARRGALAPERLAAVVLPATEIRPLEKFVVPAALDGQAGRYRRPVEQCLLAADNDYEAIVAWLRSKSGAPAPRGGPVAEQDRAADGASSWAASPRLSHTQRAYRKEAERFLLWAILAREKPLSSMTQEDCVAYRDFLADPQPKSRWCGPRARQRWSPLWRPFEGPLSPAARRQALTILRNLYAFLADQNYLMGNPWSGVAVPLGSGVQINAGRSFTASQWRFLEEQLGALAETSANARLRVALPLLYATGLRLAEIVAARVEDLVWVEYPADADDAEPVEGWLLTVIGKGQRQREVPVPTEVVEQLRAYLASRGLDPDLGHVDTQRAHLLGKAADLAERAPRLERAHPPFDPRDGIAAATLAEQLKAFFTQCALRLDERGDAKGANRFRSASTHWLRHTHASHAIARGMPLEVAQQNLGHASLATTTIYVTAEKKRRMKAVRRFWGRQA